MLGRVSRCHQRAWYIHSMLKIIILSLSVHCIAITLILSFLNVLILTLMCAHSTMTWRIPLIFTQPVPKKFARLIPHCNLYQRLRL